MTPVTTKRPRRGSRRLPPRGSSGRSRASHAHDASADRDHAVDRAARPRGDLGLDRHHVLPVAQRVAHLLERDHLHEAADRAFSRPARTRFPGTSFWRRWRIPVSVATRKRCFGDCLRELDHALGREDVRAAVRRTPSPGSRSRTRGGRAARRRAPRPASARCRRAGSRRGRGTRPSRSCSLRPGHALEPEAEVHVRAGRGSPGRPGSPRSPPSRCPDVQQ